jgi:hypothetical protein
MVGCRGAERGVSVNEMHTKQDKISDITATVTATVTATATATVTVTAITGTDTDTGTGTGGDTYL